MLHIIIIIFHIWIYNLLLLPKYYIWPLFMKTSGVDSNIIIYDMVIVKATLIIISIVNRSFESSYQYNIFHPKSHINHALNHNIN